MTRSTYSSSHQAPDILLSPLSTKPRYRAYITARHAFWKCFPSGRYMRIPTGGTLTLECGLHALRLSIQHQLPHILPVPTVEELRSVYESSETIRIGNELTGMGNENWFTVDQLGVVFTEWGRQAVKERRVRCQLGYVAEGEWPVLLGTPEVGVGEEEGESNEEKGEIVRVWVWNDGLSLAGGVGHFEGMRRPIEEELRR